MFISLLYVYLLYVDRHGHRIGFGRRWLKVEGGHDTHDPIFRQCGQLKGQLISLPPSQFDQTKTRHQLRVVEAQRLTKKLHSIEF